MSALSQAEQDQLISLVLAPAGCERALLIEPVTALVGRGARMVTWGSAGAQTGHSRLADAAEVAVPGDGAHPPGLVPALSRGRHRSPRQGACLMELASYLAGERWSAHPACTHPLLAALARDVNDHTSDAGLARLAVLAASVIGLTGDDLHVDARIALVCARTALPVAAASRQQIMAVSVLACERVLADLDGRPPGSVEEQSQAVLARVPHAAQWARSFTARSFARAIPASPQAFRQRSAPFIVHAAVEAIAQAYIPQPDQMLRDLLIAAIGQCAPQAGRGTPA